MKIKFWTITPGKYMIDALQTSDTTLILYHLIKRGNSYYKACKKFKKAGGKIVMDNSFYEYMENPPIKELVSKAKMIDADVLVLPDLPMSEDLPEQVRRNIFKVRVAGYKGKLMMCVWAQGKNWEEDLQMFKFLYQHPNIDIVAIPYCFGSRKEDKYKRNSFLHMIENRILLEQNKHVHLFGCPAWKGIREEKRWWINSVDGTLPWKCGYYKKELPIAIQDEPPRPSNYFRINKLTKLQRKIININLKRIKREVEKNEF